MFWRHTKRPSEFREEGEKPKWMRWRTYERICDQLDAADQGLGR
jgi:hypothetical protein